MINCISVGNPILSKTIAVGSGVKVWMGWGVNVSVGVVLAVGIGVWVGGFEVADGSDCVGEI
jgi:hypothetical protein